MKNVFHKYMAFFLAVVVVFSTMSVTLSMHFCGEKMTTATVLSTIKKCCEDSKLMRNTTQLTKKSCCSDVKLTKQAQELEVYKSTTSFSKVFLTSFVSTYLSLFEVPQKENPSFIAYSPPLVVKSIYKLDEVYLI